MTLKEILEKYGYDTVDGLYIKNDPRVIIEINERYEHFEIGMIYDKDNINEAISILEKIRDEYKR